VSELSALLASIQIEMQREGCQYKGCWLYTRTAGLWTERTAFRFENARRSALRAGIVFRF